MSQLSRCSSAARRKRLTRSSEARELRQSRLVAERESDSHSGASENDESRSESRREPDRRRKTLHSAPQEERLRVANRERLPDVRVAIEQVAADPVAGGPDHSEEGLCLGVRTQGTSAQGRRKIRRRGKKSGQVDDNEIFITTEVNTLLDEVKSQVSMECSAGAGNDRSTPACPVDGHVSLEVYVHADKGYCDIVLRREEILGGRDPLSLDEQRRPLSLLTISEGGMVLREEDFTPGAREGREVVVLASVVKREALEEDPPKEN